MVAVKAAMRDRPSVRELIGDINTCETALRAAFPKVRWLFFEPDLSD